MQKADTEYPLQAGSCGSCWGKAGQEGRLPSAKRGIVVYYVLTVRTVRILCINRATDRKLIK